MINTSHPYTHRIVMIYTLFFAIGALSHARDFVMNGMRPYNIAPLPIELFWTSLILIDVCVVLILLSRHKRIGCQLALLVMLIDVLINSYATIVLKFDFLVWSLVVQSILLGFILGSIWWVVGQKVSQT